MENTSVFCDELPKKKNHKELRIAVCKAVDSFDDGAKISAEMIQDRAAVFFPDASLKHLDTIMRYVRMYRREEVVCIDRHNSLYQKFSKTA